MTDTPTDRHVQGYCPVCGHESLALAAGGYITCMRLDCPQPDAASTILADHETGHIVWLWSGNYAVRHPLRERLGDQLLACDLHDDLAAADGPPRPPGMYRVPPGVPVARASEWEALPGD